MKAATERMAALPRGWLAAILLILGAALADTPAARADDDLNIQTRSDDAVVLVADPDLVDPVYAHTVLLATPMDDGSYIGVIVNRPTRQSLSSLFPEHEPSKKVHDPVYFGGPMLTQVIFALVHSDQSPGEGTLKMSNGLFLAIKETTIDHVIENTPNDAHYYVGTVMWQPGQLQQEIRRGVWSVIDADASVVFDHNPEQLWDHLRQKVDAMSVRLDLRQPLLGTRLLASNLRAGALR
jgi:putative transcriptional regulator